MPTQIYWEQKNQEYPTMVFLVMISNDLPESCSNTVQLSIELSLTDEDIHAGLKTTLSLRAHPIN